MNKTEITTYQKNTIKNYIELLIPDEGSTATLYSNIGKLIIKNILGFNPYRENLKRAFLFNPNLTIEGNVNEIKSKVERLGLDMEAVAAYGSLTSLFDHNYIRKKDKACMYSITGNTVRDLVIALRWCCTGVVDKSYKETHDFIEGIGVSSSADAYEFSLLDWHVRKWKNGKLLLDTVSTEAVRRLNQLFDCHKKLYE